MRVRIVAGKGCSRERLLAMRLFSEGILMVRDKESTSTKDIRMARNISREDNHEVPSTVQTVFKTTPKIPNPPPIISPCDPFHPAHRAPRPPFPAGALKRQKTTGTSIQDFVTTPLSKSNTRRTDCQRHKCMQGKCSGKRRRRLMSFGGFVDIRGLCSRKGVKMQTVTNGEL